MIVVYLVERQGGWTLATHKAMPLMLAMKAEHMEVTHSSWLTEASM